MSTINKQQAQWALDNVEFLKAWIDGKPIQYSAHGGCWADIAGDILMLSGKFRIKPEPRRFWVKIVKGKHAGYAYPSRTEADNHSYPINEATECIEVVEVLK